MSRNAAKKYQEEMSDAGQTSSAGAVDAKEIRRKQLVEVLSHQGMIELDIDQKRLSELRSVR